MCVLSVLTSVTLFALPLGGRCHACDSGNTDHCVRSELITCPCVQPISCPHSRNCHWVSDFQSAYCPAQCSEAGPAEAMRNFSLPMQMLQASSRFQDMVAATGSTTTWPSWHSTHKDSRYRLCLLLHMAPSTSLRSCCTVHSTTCWRR